MVKAMVRTGLWTIVRSPKHTAAAGRQSKRGVIDEMMKPTMSERSEGGSRSGVGRIEYCGEP